MMVAAHPRDLEAAQRAGLRTPMCAAARVTAWTGRQETGPHAGFDVTAGDFSILPSRLGA